MSPSRCASVRALEDGWVKEEGSMVKDRGGVLG